MGDLVVDTSALRGVAGTLRSIGSAASEMHGHGDRLSPLVPAVGAADPARALSDFLAAWSYGLGLTGHQVTLLASMLDSAAVAYDAVEARLSVAAGGAPGPVLTPASGVPAPEPPPPPPPQAARWGDLRLSQVPVQLSAATHPHQLVPGDPDDVLYLGSTLRRFAVASADAANAVRRQSTAAWAGSAAAVFAQQVGQLPAALDAAADAFGAAATALLRYAEVLSDAQLQAVLAFRLWQDAERESTAGATAGAGAEGMARAAATLARARTEVETSGRALAAVLDETVIAAPRDPGFFARLFRAVRSFGSGVTEGFVGMGEGAWALATLATRLNPATAAIDPEGHLDALKGLFSGAATIARHPGTAGKALLDWDTWATDPARAIGHLAPDLVLAVVTAGAATAGARGSKLVEEADDLADLNRLDELAHADDLARVDVFPEIYDLNRRFGKGTDEWAEAVVDRYPRLTKDEVLAIHEYSAGSVHTMNHFLRNPDAFPAAVHEARLASVEQTSAALAKLPRYAGGDLFRGTELPDHLLEQWQPGRQVSDPAFFSTTTNEAIADGFARQKYVSTPDHQGAFIRVVEHQSGVDVHQFSSVANEAEVLFDRNTAFEIVSRDWNPGLERWDFVVREAAP